MTLKKIAKEVGVSISTVSRVVNQNNPKAATLELQNRIWEVVRKTGYTPNTAARSLKNCEKPQLDSVKYITCILGRAETSQINLFFSQLIRFIEEAALKNNFLIKNILSSNELLKLSPSDLALHTNVDGAIILGRFSEEVSAFVKTHFHNILYTGLNPMNTGYDQVLCSGYSAATKAVTYLYELGHRNIGYVGERSGEVRFSAYKDTIKKLKISASFVTPVLEPHSFELGYQSAKFIKQNNVNVSGILAANDQTAIGLIQGLKDHNIKIPTDISVIGIDNVLPTEKISPQLTTVSIPLEELGKQCFQTLLSRINKTHSLPLEIYLPCKIVQRNSCSNYKYV